jgi:hypothetical protein
MALRSKSRTLNRLVTAEARRYNIPHRREISSGRFGDYTVSHRSGQTHRPSESCSLCEQHAKNAQPTEVK